MPTKTQTYWISLLSARLRHDAAWLSLRDAAHLFRVTPETMLLWVREGYITAECWDGSHHIERATLDSLLRRWPTQTPAGGAVGSTRDHPAVPTHQPTITTAGATGERGERCD